MERRQDAIEGKVTDLAAIVGRVELNQTHATELATLRFNAVDSAVKTIDGTLERFMGRINAIVSGEVKLPQAAAGEKMVAEYMEWRKAVDQRLETVEDERSIAIARNAGVFAVFGGAKATVIALAAIASPVITVIALILKG